MKFITAISLLSMTRVVLGPQLPESGVHSDKDGLEELAFNAPAVIEIDSGLQLPSIDTTRASARYSLKTTSTEIFKAILRKRLTTFSSCRFNLQPIYTALAKGSYFTRFPLLPSFTPPNNTSNSAKASLNPVPTLRLRQASGSKNVHWKQVLCAYALATTRFICAVLLCIMGIVVICVDSSPSLPECKNSLVTADEKNEPSCQIPKSVCVARQRDRMPRSNVTKAPLRYQRELSGTVNSLKPLKIVKKTARLLFMPSTSGSFMEVPDSIMKKFHHGETLLQNLSPCISTCSSSPQYDIDFILSCVPVVLKLLEARRDLSMVFCTFGQGLEILRKQVQNCKLAAHSSFSGANSFAEMVNKTILEDFLPQGDIHNWIGLYLRALHQCPTIVRSQIEVDDFTRHDDVIEQIWAFAKFYNSTVKNAIGSSLDDLVENIWWVDATRQRHAQLRIPWALRDEIRTIRIAKTIHKLLKHSHEVAFSIRLHSRRLLLDFRECSWQYLKFILCQYDYYRLLTSE